MEQQSDYRRVRVNRLKRLILLTISLAWLIPCALCIGLMVQVKGLHTQVQQLAETVQKVQMSETQTEERSIDLQTRLDTIEENITQTTQVDMEETTAPKQPEMLEVELPETEDENAEEKETQTTRRVYLTFDDGPSIYTQDILDVLKEYDVKATFFVNGKSGDQADAALVRIVEEGHTLGMHSYSHRYEQIYQSVEDFAADYEKIHQHILSVTGYDSKIYRFPGGSSNTKTDKDMKEYGAYLESRGTVYFDWNISSQDATGEYMPVSSIVKNCTTGLEKHEDCVILCHDAQGKATTVEALPIVIEKLLEMEDVELLPITEDTPLIQHVKLHPEE